jgi:hypothetical protein
MSESNPTKRRLPRIERTCPTCQATFMALQSEIKRGGGVYCSRKCFGGPPVGCICLVCGANFTAYPSEIERGEGLYCSTDCYHKDSKRPVAERFWEKVNKDGPIPEHCPELGQCWIWTAASRGTFGYGLLGGAPGEKGQLAHRVSWQLHFGPIPDGIKVLHHCDNPPCVRPDHLFLGTLKDNTQDMLSKRRHIVKLTDEQTADLRSKHASGEFSKTERAKQFGLGQSTVSRIILHKNTY